MWLFLPPLINQWISFKSISLTYPKEVLDNVAYRIARSTVGFWVIRDGFCHDMCNSGMRRRRAAVYFGPACFQEPGEGGGTIHLESCNILYTQGWIAVSSDKGLLSDSSPFEHGPAGGLLNHEENPPALEGPFYPPAGHLLPPMPDRVKGRCGTCGNGNFIGSFCKPGTILSAVQHIVWSHNPLSWSNERENNVLLSVLGLWSEELFSDIHHHQYTDNGDWPAAQAAKNFSLDKTWGIMRWVLLCW